MRKFVVRLMREQTKAHSLVCYQGLIINDFVVGCLDKIHLPDILEVAALYLCSCICWFISHAVGNLMRSDYCTINICDQRRHLQASLYIRPYKQELSFSCICESSLIDVLIKKSHFGEDGG